MVLINTIIVSTFIEFLNNCNVVDTMDVLLKVNEACSNGKELKSDVDTTTFLFQCSPLTPVEVRFKALIRSIQTTFMNTKRVCCLIHIVGNWSGKENPHFL